MRNQIPQAQVGVLAVFEQAVATIREPLARERVQLSESYQQSLEAQLDQLRGISERYTEALHGWKSEVGAHNKNLTELRRLVRDFWQVLRRRCARENCAELLDLFGVPKEPKSEGKFWLEYCQRLIIGEAAAVGVGYAPMANPEIAQLVQAQANARESMTALLLSVQVLQGVRAEMREAQLASQRKLRGLATRIREALSQAPAPLQRDIMRTFGFSFKSAETDEEPSTIGPTLELSYDA